MEKKLYRDEQRKVIGGVCAGLADYFNADVSVVRLIFVLALILKGGGGLIYIVLWIVLPKKPFAYVPPVDYTVPPAQPYQQATYQQQSYQAPVPPFVPAPRKGPSTGAIIGGLVLILLGGGLLLDQFDIVPDFDFGDWWPVILVVIGLVMILTSRNKHTPAQQTWQQPTDTNTTTVKDEPASDNNNPTSDLS